MDQLKAVDAPPLWRAVERLDNMLDEATIQYERLTKMLSPLYRQADQPSNNGVPVPPSDQYGSSQLTSRLGQLADRLELLGRGLCRTCNELEI